MSGITVHCSHCNSALKLKDRSRLGSKVKCPQCGRPFVLAEGDDEWAGLEPAGPASRGGAPVVHRSKKSGGGSKKRGKASSGMSGALLGLLIAGGALCLLLAVGVGLWAAGVFSPDDGAVVAQNDATEASPADVNTSSPPEQDTTTTTPAESTPEQDPALTSTPDDETPTPAVVANAASPEAPVTEARTPSGSVSDEEAERIVRERLDSFLEAVATAEVSDVAEVMQSYFVDEETTRVLFGVMGDDAWTATQEANAELFNTPPNEIRESSRLLRSTNTQFELVDHRQVEARSITRAILATMPEDARVYRSRVTTSLNGRQFTQDFLVWVLIDGQVHALPDLDDISSRLDREGKLVMPGVVPRALVPLDESGRAFTGEEAGQSRNDNGLEATFVWCPPGRFRMGAPEEEQMRHVGRVELKELPADVELTRGFWIGRTEVTQAQWTAVMPTTPWDASSDVETGDDFPASYITFADAAEFCSRLTASEREAGRLPQGWEYALPTEAQWEYACRAGTTTAFSFGDDPESLPEHAWCHSNTIEAGEAYPHRVARKTPNAWGLYDMHGNVEELCGDLFYERLPGGVDPLGARFGQYRTHRGGAYEFDAPWNRSAVRGGEFYLVEDDKILSGFRAAIVRGMVAAETDGDSADPQPEALATSNMTEGAAGVTREDPAVPVDEFFDFADGPRSAVEARSAQEFWAGRLEREIVEENSVGMKLVLIPPGRYQMGSPRSEYRGRFNSPDIAQVEQQHAVSITRPFYFGMYEVTTTEFEEVTGERAGLNFGRDVDDSRFPVTWVTMEQVQGFLDALSEKEGRTYRLPTEAEWEYACRAGTTTPFWTGETIDGDQLNCHAEDAYLDGKPGTYLAVPTNVGSFEPNPFGLYDVHGNVAELCSDWYDRTYYARSPETDPPGPEKPGEDPEHLARGGGYHAGIDMQRSAVRWGAHEDGQADQIGFRVVMEP